MPLATCDECKSDLSEHAEACPHCNSPAAIALRTFREQKYPSPIDLSKFDHPSEERQYLNRNSTPPLTSRAYARWNPAEDYFLDWLVRNGTSEALLTPILQRPIGGIKNRINKSALDRLLQRLCKFNVTDDIYSVGPYYPQRLKEHDACQYSKDILALKSGTQEAINFFARLLKDLLPIGYTICMIPGHNLGGSDSALKRCIKRLGEQVDFDDQSDNLSRVKDVAKKAQGGDRSKEGTLESVKVLHPDEIKGKDIALLDDVTTSGNSMMACRDLLEKAGAKSVTSIAFARTYHQNNIVASDHAQDLIRNVRRPLQNHEFEECANKIRELSLGLQHLMDDNVFGEKDRDILEQYKKIHEASTELLNELERNS